MIPYTDILYGARPIPPDVAQIIACPTFQRLRRINQSGASRYSNPYKRVNRFEHSVGAYLLLCRLGADREEQIAGLLHDISHTAFSHVIDLVFQNEEQAYHEQLKAEFLSRPDICRILHRLGFQRHRLLSDELYPLLERPLPELCADRIDYSLRDAVTVGEASLSTAQAIIDDLTVCDARIVMRTPDLAREYANLFDEMNATQWASQQENYLYELMAQAIEIGLQSGVLAEDDLMSDDLTVETKLRSAGNPHIESIFARLTAPPPAEVAAFTAVRPIKQRAIDPAVLVDGAVVPLSRL